MSVLGKKSPRNYQGAAGNGVGNSYESLANECTSRGSTPMIKRVYSSFVDEVHGFGILLDTPEPLVIPDTYISAGSRGAAALLGLKQ